MGRVGTSRKDRQSQRLDLFVSCLPLFCRFEVTVFYLRRKLHFSSFFFYVDTHFSRIFHISPTFSDFILFSFSLLYIHFNSNLA